MARAVGIKAMSATIVKFPTRRIVARHFVYDLGRGEEIEAISLALRSVERAIKALHNQRQSLCMRFQAAVRRRDSEADGHSAVP
jgi:hypothetical protein